MHTNPLPLTPLDGSLTFLTVCRQEVRNSHIILFILGKEFSQMVWNEYNNAVTPPKKMFLFF